MTDNVVRVNIQATDLSKGGCCIKDTSGNTYVEIKDGATHVVYVAELPQLIKQVKDVFELTIKTIPYNDKDCLVTFKKL